MNNLHSRADDYPSSLATKSLLILFVCIPVSSLLIKIVAWLTFGIDLPYYDDWRSYDYGRAASLNIKDLFTPSNDTIYAVGLLFDGLAQIFLNGNSIAYQAITMVVLLGGLLWAQWTLLRSVLEDDILSTACFSLSFLTIQTGGYWGSQNIAYHHGIPLLSIMFGLIAVLSKRWSPWWGLPFVILMGLLAGFSYISGALSSLVASAVMILLGLTLDLHNRKALLEGGFAFAFISAICTGIQLWVIVFFQGGQIHDPKASWAWPYELDYWLFLIGKIARSLALPPQWPTVSLVLATSVVVILLCINFWLLGLLRSKSLTVQTKRFAVIYVTLFAVVSSYLMLLSSGRAELRPETISEPLQVFTFAFRNTYHFLWATIIWPWLLVALVLWLRVHLALKIIQIRIVASCVAILFVIYAISAGSFNHPDFFERLSERRQQTQVSCLQSALDSNKPILCPSLYPADLTNAFTYGRLIGASYSRYFRPKPIPVGQGEGALLFKLSRISADDLQTVRMKTIVKHDDSFEFVADRGALLVLRPSDGLLSSCLEVEIGILIRVGFPDRIRAVFTSHQKDKEPTQVSVTAPVQPQEEGYQNITLSAQSLIGFEDGIRVYPLTKQGGFGLRELEVRCRVQGPIDRLKAK